MRKHHPLAWQGPSTDFATTHCMQCEAGWTRSGQGASVIICLLDRERKVAAWDDEFLVSLVAA